MDEFLNEAPALPRSQRNSAICHDLEEGMRLVDIEQIANEHSVENRPRSPAGSSNSRCCACRVTFYPSFLEQFGLHENSPMFREHLLC